MDSSNTYLSSDSYMKSITEEWWSRNGSALSGSGLSLNKAGQGQLTLAPETSSSAGKRHEQMDGRSENKEQIEFSNDVSK